MSGRTDARDLWIDSVCHRVPHAVWAHVRFLTDLNDGLVAKVAPEPIRWTPDMKGAVVRCALAGPEGREIVIRTFELSDEELDGWIKNFETYGVAGLKVTSIPMLREMDA